MHNGGSGAAIALRLDFKALVNGDKATQEKKPAAEPARKR